MTLDGPSKMALYVIDFIAPTLYKQRHQSSNKKYYKCLIDMRKKSDETMFS